MTRDQLEHAIRAACEVARDPELYVFGSQAILGEFPQAPPSIRASIEVDVQPKNIPDAVEAIDGSLGELSPFHEAFGFYVHGVSLNAAVLPHLWEGRTIPVSGHGPRASTGYCLESHDLAASKLAAFREKDREFVITLLVEGLIRVGTLRERIYKLPPDTNDPHRTQRLLRWVQGTAHELGL